MPSVKAAEWSKTWRDACFVIIVGDAAPVLAVAES